MGSANKLDDRSEWISLYAARVHKAVPSLGPGAAAMTAKLPRAYVVRRASEGYGRLVAEFLDYESRIERVEGE